MKFEVLYKYGVSPLEQVNRLDEGELYATSCGDIVEYNGEEFIPIIRSDHKNRPAVLFHLLDMDQLRFFQTSNRGICLARAPGHQLGQRVYTLSGTILDYFVELQVGINPLVLDGLNGL